MIDENSNGNGSGPKEPHSGWRVENLLGRLLTKVRNRRERLTELHSRHEPLTSPEAEQ
jgi:hypothetical protein